MAPASDPLRQYLNPEEPLTAEFTATLREDSRRTAVSVGITDRRILCASEHDGMISIDYDSICSVRSDSLTNHTYRGFDYRLLMGFGGLVALLGLVGLIGVSASTLVPALTVGVIAGLASAEYLRRHPDAVDWDAADEVREHATRIEERYGLRRSTDRMTAYAEDNRSLVAVGAAIGLVAYAGIVLIAPGALALAFGLLIVVGLATVEYAYGRRDDFDGIEVVPQRRTEITIDTTAGSTIHLTSDATDGIDRELNRQVFARPVEASRDVSLPTY